MWRGPIVVGVDGSSGAAGAVRFVAPLSAEINAEVIVVHAAELVHLLRKNGSFRGYADEPVDEAASALLAGARRMLDEVCVPLRVAGVRHRAVLVEDSPAQAILRVAEEESARMIVIGRQGRRGRNQYGSSTIGDEIVRHAECPVTVVPAPILDRPLGESALGEYLRSPQARRPSSGGRGPARRRRRRSAPRVGHASPGVHSSKSTGAKEFPT